MTPPTPTPTVSRRRVSPLDIPRWDDCYGESWKGIITPESFAHPAKFSKALIERIFDHCLERGWLKRGDLVGDAFGGVGLGGIIAAYRGLHWIGVELEPRFVKFAEANFALHADRWHTLGLPQPRIVQGDSRHFDQVVQCAGIVTSPPYAETAVGGGKLNISMDCENRDRRSSAYKAGVGYADESPGQIGRLKSGSVAAIVTSPPYAHQVHGSNGIDKSKLTGNPAGPNSQAGNGDYGTTDGQIAGLPEGKVDCVVTSPPFSAPNMQPKIGQGHRENCPNPISQGSSEGNIETLQPGNLNAVVTSPPYEGTDVSFGKQIQACQRRLSNMGATRKSSAMLRCKMTADDNAEYGQSAGQIGNDKGETYWQAMALVYASCYSAIKPGGIIAVVVKDYVQKGKRVPLCDDTARLLEHCGFEIVERVHAMLTKETRHGDLFNGETVATKSRKSFFRRLAEKKGSPPIDFEEVIFAKRS